MNRPIPRPAAGTTAALAVLAVLLVVGAIWWLTSSAGAEATGGRGSGEPAAGGSVAGSTGQGQDGSPGTAGDPDIEPGPDEPGTVTSEPKVRDARVVRVDGYTADGRSLTLSYTTGVPECYGEVGTPVVRETADRVTVVLRTVPPPSPPEACIDLGVLGEVTVVLDEPLGDRRLVDAGTVPASPIFETETAYDLS